MVIYKFATIALALLFATACDFSPEEPIPTSIETHDGLRFSISEDHEVIAKKDYLLVALKKLPPRRFTRIEIWTAPARPLPKGKVIEGHKPAAHTLVKTEGGMGGPEYWLFIPKRIGARDITVQAYQQVEYGKPHFKNVWALWESLEIATEDAVKSEN